MRVNIPDSGFDEQIVDEAADWMLLLIGEPVSEDRALALAEWRARSPEHDAAFRHIVSMRRRAQTPAARPSNVTRRTMIAGTVAAAVGAYGLARPPLGLWPSFAELMAAHRTKTGERYAFSPTAGVKVEMNSRTSLSVKDGNKAISLIDGEVFVTVSQITEMFAVAAGLLQAVTSDGQFNVQAISDTIQVACVAGTVHCRRGDWSASLHADEQFAVTSDGTATRSSVSAAEATAWRRGLLIFRGTVLSEVIAQINRYRSAPIILTSKTLERQPMQAIFHLDAGDDIIDQIEGLTGAKARWLPGGVVLLG